jgi:hypothetical protein
MSPNQNTAYFRIISAHHRLDGTSLRVGTSIFDESYFGSFFCSFSGVKCFILFFFLRQWVLIYTSSKSIFFPYWDAVLKCTTAKNKKFFFIECFLKLSYNVYGNSIKYYLEGVMIPFYKHSQLNIYKNFKPRILNPQIKISLR